MSHSTSIARPVRLQRSRKKGFKLVSPNGLPIKYCGRPTKYGNEYIIGDVGCSDPPKPMTAKMAVQLFREYQLPEMIEDGSIEELRGHNLSCFCKLSEPCHVDVILEYLHGKT